jgi:hypothetical protein
MAMIEINRSTASIIDSFSMRYQTSFASNQAEIKNFDQPS